MTSIREDDSSLFVPSGHRSITPLSAPHQSDVALDFRYDPGGRLLERKFEVTTLLADAYLPKSQHDEFSYDGAASSGTFERKGQDPWGGDKQWAIPPESSSTTCAAETTCKAMPPIDGALSLCAPGLGINSWPLPYLHVPGLDSPGIGGNDCPWYSVPFGFAADGPYLRAVVGY